MSTKVDDIIYKEVEMAMKGLKKRKSPGYDGIHGEMIQAEENLHREIHKVCIEIWATGNIPE